MRRAPWAVAVSAVVLAAVSACAGETSNQAAQDQFEALVGTPVPVNASAASIVREGRLDPLLTARFRLPRHDITGFLTDAGLNGRLVDEVVEIERVPAQLSDDFESIESFQSMARDDGSTSVAVHVSAGDPALVFVQAFDI